MLLISWLSNSSLFVINSVDPLLLFLSGPRVCNFLNGWQGGWYESGIGEVQITSDSISRKGTCLENRTDYYLLENRLHYFPHHAIVSFILQLFRTSAAIRYVGITGITGEFVIFSPKLKESTWDFQNSLEWVPFRSKLVKLPLAVKLLILLFFCPEEILHSPGTQKVLFSTVVVRLRSRGSTGKSL